MGKSGISRTGKTLIAAVVAGAFIPAGASAGMRTPTVDPSQRDAVTCEFAAHLRLTARRPDVRQIINGGLLHATTSFEQDRPATANCTGRINGRIVRGTGPMAIAGSFQDGALCLTGHGQGSITLAMPGLIEFSQHDPERVTGSFRLDLSETAWRQAGSVLDARGKDLALTAASRFTPDAGRGCTVRAGTLAGRLVIGS